MTGTEDASDREQVTDYDGRYAFDRRKLLAGLGAVGAMAVAGCSGGSDQTTTTTTTTTSTDTETATDTATETMQQTTTQDEGMDSTIGRRFGYTGTRGSEPPVEADHTIGLELRPVQGREIPEFFFDPVGLQVDVGDTVRFQLNSPHHNVNAYHPGIGYNQRVPDDVPPFSSPILTPGDYWLYTFDREGVYDYMCAPHEIFGMVGRIVCGSATGPGANPVGEAPGGQRTRPPEFTAALVYQDDAMAPDNIVSQGSVAWSDLADESKRLTLVPAEHGGGGENGGNMTTTTGGQ